MNGVNNHHQPNLDSADTATSKESSNRRRRVGSSEISVTAEGWLFIVILAFISVGAVLRNVNLLILMAGMMIAPLIINWRLSALRAKTLSARRSLPYRVHAGAMTGIQWLCFNHSFLDAWGIEIVDSLEAEKLSGNSATLNPSQPLRTRLGSVASAWWQALQASLMFESSSKAAYNLRLNLPSIGGNQQEVISTRVYFTQRGEYRCGPALLVTRFPFGLISMTMKLDSVERLYVAPKLGTLTPVWNRRVRSILTGEDALLKRRGLAGDDFYALRKWRSGDSRKLIHWRTSAKYGHPIVKQFEQPDNRDFAMLLDLWAPAISGDAVDADPACETCLSFATTVILNIGSQVKGRIGLAICGSATSIMSSRSQLELVDSAMRALAVAQPSAEPELIDALLRIADSVSPHTPLIVVSPRPRVDLPVGDDQPDSPRSSRLRSVWDAVVWLQVDSDEFKELFQLETENQEFEQLVTKWGRHVSH